MSIVQPNSLFKIIDYSSFSLKQQKLRTSWKATRSQRRQLTWQMDSLFGKYLLIMSILLTRS